MTSVFSVIDVGILPAQYQINLSNDAQIIGSVAGDLSLSFSPGPGRVIMRLTNTSTLPVNWTFVGFHKLLGTYDSRPNAINYIYVEGFGNAPATIRIYQPESPLVAARPTITYRLNGVNVGTFELLSNSYKAMIRSVTSGLSIAVDFGNDGYVPPPGYGAWPTGTGFVADPTQPGLTASANGLLVTSSTTANRQIRSNISVSTGRFAFKCTIQAMQNIGNVCGVGVLGADVPIDNLGDTNVHLYQGTSVYVPYRNQSRVSIAPPFTVGAIFEVLLDLP